MVGFVLAQNYEKDEVDLRAIQRFAQAELGVKMSGSTVSDYLRRLGLSVKRVEVRTAGFKLNDQELVENVRSFVLE